MGANEEQHQRSLRGREATREVMSDQSSGELRMLMETGRDNNQTIQRHGEREKAPKGDF